MLQNLRDAGGYVTRSGKRLRTGLLFRADAPVNLDGAAQRHLIALGLNTIVDLRRGRERDRWPSDLAWFSGRLEKISLVGNERRPVNPLNGGLGGFNRWLYEMRGDTIAQVVEALAAPGALPALVHCTAGKDRTGVVVALIQSWLELPDDVIAVEYARSAELLRADTEDAIEKQRIALGVDPRERPDLLEARPEWIVDALDDLRRRHGTPERYLLAHGARADDLRQLRTALVEP